MKVRPYLLFLILAFLPINLFAAEEFYGYRLVDPNDLTVKEDKSLFMHSVVEKGNTVVYINGSDGSVLHKSYDI